MRYVLLLLWVGVCAAALGFASFGAPTSVLLVALLLGIVVVVAWRKR